MRTKGKRNFWCILSLVGCFLIGLGGCSASTREESSLLSQSSSSGIESSLSESESDHRGQESIKPNQKEEEGMNASVFYVTVKGVTFSAVFAENAGAQALKEELRKGPITIQMDDYGGFEKVGSLGKTLPTANAQTTTKSGDIVLYQGNQIVIFYGSNSWSYTRLGRVENRNGWEKALSSGSVSVTFSLTKEP